MGGAIATLHNTPEVKAGHTPEWSVGRKSFCIEGELYHVSPLSMSTNGINFTSFPGKCSSTLFSMMFWFGKTKHIVYKVDDKMEISPLHAQFYQLTMQQKQALERQIKESLAGVSAAITDFELLFHDLRKYKDFIEYLTNREKALKTKDNELLMRTEQSLKAIFIDQVDVHTGEGVALKLIAPRWPTIIADFMQMKDEDTDPKKIGKKYSVSEAEGVVLATKNKLYMEWRETFEKTVKERYQRLLGMVQARKFSIDEYKNMLKPYIERYKAINEMGADERGRAYLREISWLRPGAQTTSFDWATICAFKTIARPEPARVSFERLEGDENILKMDFCPSFKNIIRKNIKYLKDNELGKIPLPKTGVEPLDKWAWALYKYIEDYYNVRFTLKELVKIRNEFVGGWGGESEPYWKCFETDVERAIIRLPDGTELEDMTFKPLYYFLETQNMMLLRYIEIKAQEKYLENYINEMLGDTSKSKKLEELSVDYEKLFHVYPEEKSEKGKAEEISAAIDLRAAREMSQKQVMREVTEMKRPFKLFKGGKYEPRFDDLITGPYFDDIGGSMGKVWAFLKAKFDVPGFAIEGVRG